MDTRIVYLMRGLPACGKTHTARKLAGDTGIVLETDEFFYTQVGTDYTTYDFSEDLLPAARRWVVERFQVAISRDVSPIVIDRGNGLNRESQVFARYALDHNYRAELREPESEWWQEIRVLLKYKEFTQPILDQWADRLAEISRGSHRVPAETIRSWMTSWRHDLTVEEILAYTPQLDCPSIA